ncbi:hypothetical protein A2U01_0100504, partial [Trifolium medium]|nr:hypothetical protein [Trifolium medium]
MLLKLIQSSCSECVQDGLNSSAIPTALKAKELGKSKFETSETESLMSSEPISSES